MHHHHHHHHTTPYTITNKPTPSPSPTNHQTSQLPTNHHASRITLFIPSRLMVKNLLGFSIWTILTVISCLLWRMCRILGSPTNRREDRGHACCSASRSCRRKDKNVLICMTRHEIFHCEMSRQTLSEIVKIACNICQDIIVSIVPQHKMPCFCWWGTI